MKYVDIITEDNYDDFLPEEFTLTGAMGNLTFTKTFNTVSYTHLTLPTTPYV